MIKILGRRNSANVQKVMWTLGELGLKYQREDVAGSFGFPNNYNNLNPNNVVPTIQDGDLSLWESNACVRYLARTYGSGSLWPTDPKALATADQWMDWQRSDISHSFFILFFNTVRLPLEKRSPSHLQKGLEKTGHFYQQLDRQLASRAFVAGDELTHHGGYPDRGPYLPLYGNGY